jgi:hypothetical protein
MSPLPRRFIDSLNIALIAGACALAHWKPYGLLFFSYAVLGPAHYLTQISWLHDRRYFSELRFIAPLFSVIAVLLAFCSFYNGPGQILIATGLFCLALSISLIAVLPSRSFVLYGIAAGCALLLFISAIAAPALAVVIAVLLPTVLHVFVFTAAFMWAGARRSGKMASWLAIFALLACAASFFTGLGAEVAPAHPGILFFRPLMDFMHDRLGFLAVGETQLFGFLSFAYTYHYLNWFSKAEIIHWHRIPAARMRKIVAIYCIAVAVYAYSYTLGLLTLLFLAHLHVMLEFPLNMRTFAALLARPKAKAG